MGRPIGIQPTKTITLNKKIVSFFGILGVSLFAIAAIVGALLIDDYSIISQYISESFGSNTKYGWYLQYFGYVPSGIFTTLYCLLAPNFLPKSKWSRAGWLGLTFFYGIGALFVGLFPCDEGCNVKLIEPSIAQFIHTIFAALTYVFVPISILSIGLGLRKYKNYQGLSATAITAAVVSSTLILILFSNPESDYRGLFQRVIELIFIIWMVSSAVTLWSTSRNRLLKDVK